MTNSRYTYLVQRAAAVLEVVARVNPNNAGAADILLRDVQRVQQDLAQVAVMLARLPGDFDVQHNMTATDFDTMRDQAVSPYPPPFPPPPPDEPDELDDSDTVDRFGLRDEM